MLRTEHSRAVPTKLGRRQQWRASTVRRRRRRRRRILYDGCSPASGIASAVPH